MITVKPRLVPQFLRQSEFFLSLDSKGGSFKIPRGCYMVDPAIRNAHDLVSLLHTMRFWCADCIPASAVLFCITSNLRVLAPHLVDFEKDLLITGFLSALCLGSNVGVPSGRDECKKYMSGSGKPMKWDEVPGICVSQLCKIQLRGGDGAWNPLTCALAARHGLLHALRFLHEHGCPWDARTCEAAAEAKSLACLRYAHEHGCPWDARTCTKAAAHEVTDCLQYAHGHGCPWDQCALSCAIHSISIGVTTTACFDYLRLHGCPLGETVMAAAAAAGDVSLLRTLHAEACPWSAYVCRRAAISGQVGALKYLHEQGCPWGPESCTAAACGKSVECLKYSHEHGCPLNADTLLSAINHVPCLEYVLGLPKFPGRDTICEQLVAKGDLSILQYAMERGGPLTAAASTAAAGAGALDMLTYLHEQGCPWGADTCTSAAAAGSLPCLRYAHEHGCVWDVAASWAAACHRDISCLQYVHEHGCAWSVRTCASAAAAGSLACLQYAHEHGCPWNAGTTACAILSGHIDCLRYAHERGCPWQYTMVKRRLPEPLSAAQQECMQYALAQGIYEPPLQRLGKAVRGTVRQVGTLLAAALRWSSQRKVGIEPCA